jgi:hypothetical protein
MAELTTGNITALHEGLSSLADSVPFEFHELATNLGGLMPPSPTAKTSRRDHALAMSRALG